MTLLKRDVEKLTKVKDPVIKVVPRTNATTNPLTGCWVDTVHDDGARKARCTTRWYEQTLNGNEDSFPATPAMMHLKMILVDAALKGLQRGLLPKTFEPERNGEPSLDRASSRLSWGQTTFGKPCQHSQVSREHRERGIRTAQAFSRIPCKWSSRDTTFVSNHIENE